MMCDSIHMFHRPHGEEGGVRGRGRGRGQGQGAGSLTA